ncbi:hypothetical protein [Streptomyces chrestomyceticus]|uniref:hypothetical protein n=1 Tax=Streptomyces chrestomyceticus TaxID=68185 RepID=UPI0035A9206A
MTTRLLTLELQMRQGNSALLALQRHSEQLVKDVAELADQTDRLERRMRSFMAAQAQQRHAIASGGSAQLEGVARQYRAFVEQRLYPLATVIAELDQGPAAGASPSVLLRLGELTRVFFESRRQSGDAEDVLMAGLPPELQRTVGDSAREALEIWDLVEQAGSQFRWDFEIVPGSLIETPRQRAWPSCDGSLPALFVVAPALVGNEEVYCQQLVCTGPAFPG